MANELIITCAIIGAEVSEENFPYFPKGPEALAEEARRAVEAGASIIHLHCRDENGKPTQSVEMFELMTKKIKERCNCILQYSTGGAAGTPLELRCNPLKLKPEMATLSMGTLNFGPDLFENTENTIRTIAKHLMENNVFPELEIFDYGMVEAIPRYLKNKWIPEKYHVDFVLGVPGGMTGTIKNLQLLVEHLAPTQSWTVAGIGRTELPLATHAIAMGGHVRVGLEDNVYYRKGEFVKSNADLVARIVRIAKELDREVASPEVTRKILGIKT